MEMEKERYAYACYNNNSEIRADSTSGGIFSLLAEYVIDRLDGYVCGAVFDDHYGVQHILTNSVEELHKIRGSKYPQSSMNDCFVQVKKLLCDGKYVLFTGTPCHVAAIKAYLGKEYANLYLMDFVCHGVASPEIWKDYINSLGGNEIKSITFKDKVKSWKRWYLKIVYDNKVFYQRGRMNPFMKSYLQYANIRPSCYKCRFKGLDRMSDFTISDCWGVGERDMEINDDKGLSALVIHSSKGKEIFDILASNITFKEYDPDLLMKENWTCFESVKENKNRKEFFDLWHEKGVQKALNKYFSPKLDDWIYYYYLKILGKEK